MEEGGFYVMYRGWMENAVFAREPYTECQAFEWLIAKAAWDDSIHSVGRRRVKVGRGQIAVSVRYLALAWDWKKDRVGRFLQRLKNATMIETASETEYSLITICNYRRYQDINGGDATAGATLDATGSRQQRDTTATKYNDNQINKINQDSDAREALKEVAPSAVDPVRAAKMALADWIEGFFNAPVPLPLGPAWDWLGKGASIELIQEVVTDVTARARKTQPEWRPRGLRYFTPEIEKRLAQPAQQAIVAADKAQASVDAVTATWDMRVSRFKGAGFWNEVWGDRPDSADCPAPRSILVKHGYRKGS